MTIDGRAVRLYQDVLLIGRHDIALHSANHSSTGSRGIKQRLDHFARLERTAFNALSISCHTRIAFTIRQRTHCTHRLGRILITRYVTKRYPLRKHCPCRPNAYSHSKHEAMYQKVLFHRWFHFCHNSNSLAQMLNSSSTLMSFLSKGLSVRIHSEKGTYTISLLRTPTITLRCPCLRASIAPTPVRDAKMRS